MPSGSKSGLIPGLTHLDRPSPSSTGVLVGLTSWVSTTGFSVPVANNDLMTLMFWLFLGVGPSPSVVGRFDRSLLTSGLVITGERFMVSGCCFMSIASKCGLTSGLKHLDRPLLSPIRVLVRLASGILVTGFIVSMTSFDFIAPWGFLVGVLMLTRLLLLILLSPVDVGGAVTLRPGNPVCCLSLGVILVKAFMARESASELGRLRIELSGRDFWIGLGPKEAFLIIPYSSYSSTSIFIGLLALVILILPILCCAGVSRFSDSVGILMNEGNL
jgi:hypothetical protein